MLLPEEAHCRVPRTVVAIPQPTKVRRRGQHQPHRLAHRARKMGDGRIHADHQVEICDRSGRVTKIGKLRAEIGDARVRQLLDLVRLQLLLQRHEVGATSTP